MALATAWVFAGWLVLSVPLGMCVGAVLRRTSSGLASPARRTIHRHAHALSVCSASPLTPRAHHLLCSSDVPRIPKGTVFYRPTRKRAA